MPGALARFPRWINPIRIIVLALLAFLLSAATSQAAGLKKYRITSHAKDTQTINGYLLRPKGRGPFPAVVALHGCGGLWKRNSKVLTSRHADWGKRLQKAGYVVLFPDSFGSRGQNSLCKIKKRPVKHSHRVGDVRGAADWLATQPLVFSKRIALLGWSNGAMSLLWSLAPDEAPTKTEFITAIGFYPGCRTISRKTTWEQQMTGHRPGHAKTSCHDGVLASYFTKVPIMALMPPTQEFAFSRTGPIRLTAMVLST